MIVNTLKNECVSLVTTDCINAAEVFCCDVPDHPFSELRLKLQRGFEATMKCKMQYCGIINEEDTQLWYLILDVVFVQDIADFPAEDFAEAAAKIEMQHCPFS